MKWIDIPPVWLLVFAALTWASRTTLRMPLPSWLGTLLVCLGLALMLAAVFEMQRRRTTPIPHMQPSALVASGIFAVSRNPIYLGDVLVLVGLSLRWDAPLGVLMAPAFVWVLTQRFIVVEEARLHAAFPDTFPTYRKTVRRWL